MNLALSEVQPNGWLRTVLVGRNPRMTLARVLVLLASAYLLFKFVFVPIEVVGVSMAPNYTNGQVRLVNKLAYRKANPKRGDVVAVRMKSEPVVLLKRVVGLPGEHVSIIFGTVTINKVTLHEDYVRSRTHASWDLDRVVPEGHFLLIGDNRSMRMEDHYWYLATKEEIFGKVAF